MDYLLNGYPNGNCYTMQTYCMDYINHTYFIIDTVWGWQIMIIFVCPIAMISINNSSQYRRVMVSTLPNWEVNLRLVIYHYSDVLMCAMASQITSLTIVYATVYSKRRSNKTSKLRITGLCAGNSPVTGEFPAGSVSNVENISIWWRHHVGSIWTSLWWSVSFCWKVKTNLTWNLFHPCCYTGKHM